MIPTLVKVCNLKVETRGYSPIPFPWFGNASDGEAGISFALLIKE